MEKDKPVRHRTNPVLSNRAVIVFVAGIASADFALYLGHEIPTVLFGVVSWLVANQVSGEHTVILLRPITEAIGKKILKPNILPLGNGEPEPKKDGSSEEEE